MRSSQSQRASKVHKPSTISTALMTITGLILALALLAVAFPRLGRETRDVGLAHGRSAQRSFDGPASTQSLVKRRLFQAEPFAPLDTRQRDAVESQLVIGADVSGLFFRRRPAAIPRSIRPVAVLSIDGMTPRRARTHVRVEVLERIAPTLADDDSAAAVKRIIRGFRIQAPRANRLPRGEFGRVGHAVSARRHLPNFIRSGHV